MSISVIDYGSGNLKSAAKALETAVNNINSSQKVVVTSELIKDKELEIEDFALELINLQEKRFGSNGDMIKQRIKLLQPIQDQVLTIIQEIAKEKKYDFIFDRSSEGTMLYSVKNYDISDLVIKRLNRNKKIQERKEKIEDLKNKAKN